MKVITAEYADKFVSMSKIILSAIERAEEEGLHERAIRAACGTLNICEKMTDRVISTMIFRGLVFREGQLLKVKEILK